MLDVSEDGHTDDGVDESDEGQESTDVEQGREGDHQGEQELPDPLGGLDQPQDSTDPEHPHHPEQGGRHREILCFKKNKVSKMHNEIICSETMLNRQIDIDKYEDLA